jgi:hypothetical protein
MNEPSRPTIKRLFAVSGNRCAFPSCKMPLVDQASGKVTGRICHIKARSAGGPRYDPLQTDEERHAYDNLLMMCPIHHDVIDTDVDSYTVERLQRMKAQHESQHEGGSEPSEQVVEKLLINSNTVVDGSIITVLSQSGGQIAHSITNIDRTNTISINYFRKKIKPIKFGHLHLSTNNLQDVYLSAFVLLIFIAVISIIDFIRAIMGTISLGDVFLLKWFPLSHILLFVLIIIGAGAKKYYTLKFARLGNLSFEIGEDEKSYLTEIAGICPICSSEVVLKNMPQGPGLKWMGICTWNRDMHTFSFDYTTFTGVYYPVVWRKVVK